MHDRLMFAGRTYATTVHAGCVSGTVVLIQSCMCYLWLADYFTPIIANFLTFFGSSDSHPSLGNDVTNIGGSHSHDQGSRYLHTYRLTER